MLCCEANHRWFAPPRSDLDVPVPGKRDVGNDARGGTSISGVATPRYPSSRGFCEERLLEVTDVSFHEGRETLQVDRKELRELLDEWGQVFLQALRDTSVAPVDQSSRVGFTVSRPVEHGPSAQGRKLLVPPVRPRVATESSAGSPLPRKELPPARPRADTEASSSAVPVNSVYSVVKSKLPWKTERMQRAVLGQKPSVSPQGAHLEKTWWRKRFANLVGSTKAELFCAIVILANAILIGWLSDYRITHSNDQPTWALRAEVGFTLFFALEVAVKLLAYGPDFFCDESWRWNMFDLVLVAQSTVTAIANVGTFSVNSNSSFLRVLRVTKILRVLRILRFLRGFRELRLIRNSIMGSASAMFWSMLLFFFVTYVFGVVFVQAATPFVLDNDPALGDVALLKKYWGSLFSSMHSLFVSSTGGDDWIHVSAPLQALIPEAYGLFLVYIAFFLFAVTNSIMSLFVEATMKFSALDNVLAIHHELERKDQHIGNLQEFFSELDVDNDGLISYEDFQDSVDDRRLQAFALSLGINVYDTLAFFKTLSGDVKKAIDLDTFVVGCIKLQGEAKAVDVYCLFDQMQELTHALEFKMKRLDAKLDDLYPSQAADPDTSWRGSL